MGPKDRVLDLGGGVPPSRVTSRSAVGMHEGMIIASEKLDYALLWSFWTFLVVYVIVTTKKHDLF
jgi:hypothetical protein